MAGSKKVPGFGKLLDEVGSIFVDRSRGDSRHATQEAIAEYCENWRPGDRPLLIFPEGTTTNGRGLIDFKKGAFVSGRPVRPVLIVYTGPFDPATTSYTMSETGDISAFSHAEWAAQMVGHFKHSCEVRVLPPYLPSEEEQQDPGA